tara:strand:- start:75 stop:488 length:414 start_codon:yes stop_codon:yes gene_type:complete
MTEASRVQKLLIEQNAEIDRLKEEVRQLREELAYVEMGFLDFLSPQQAGILTGICQREVATHAYIESITETHGQYSRYEGELHQGQRTKVAVCKLRKKLKPHGIEIKVLRGVGYYMDNENKRKLRRVSKGKMKWMVC